MRDHLSFTVNGALRTLRHVSPTKTLLRYLREDEKLCGVKEGCAEGDCGACTVTVTTLAPDGSLKREAINSCIRFLPSLDGASITTVEALSQSSDAPHPVQKKMIDHNGSQCGFCTPGFVMSLFTAYRNGQALPLQAANDLLAGNLCRCTGYGPILTAANKIGMLAQKADQTEDNKKERSELQALAHDEEIALEHDGARAFLPTSSDALADLFLKHPDATLVAGATDVGLWVTKERRPLNTLIFLNRVKDLSVIEKSDDEIRLGATASYTGCDGRAGDCLSGPWRTYTSYRGCSGPKCRHDRR